MNFFFKKRKSGLLAIENGSFIEKFTVIKFKDKDRRLENKPYDILENVCERGINCLLNVGINEIWELVTGLSTDHYANANAAIGIGSDATAANATQTDLLFAGAEWASMDAGYPTVVGQIATWSGTFADGEAEYAWEECAVRNTAPITMNRVVSAKGTKAGGEEWVARLAITLS